jgi:uncharacterized protein YutE (UPF0331/DUF86 family)
MVDLKQAIAVEEEFIVSTLRMLEQTIVRAERTEIELAAMATFTHNVYSGMENLLKRALLSVGESPPQSASSHKDLLDFAVDFGIIKQSLSEELDAYRGFRHFFVHGYGVRLEEAQLMPLAMHLPAVWERFKAQLTAFAATGRGSPT